MRESLFSILGDLTGCSFLDLFSGSGCVAIEAASRGASPIHLVEMDRGKKATIEKNLSFVEEDKKLFVMDAERYILSSLISYDIVYADPPFPMEGKVNLLKNISSPSLAFLGYGCLGLGSHPAIEESRYGQEFEGGWCISANGRTRYGYDVSFV